MSTAPSDPSTCAHCGQPPVRPVRVTIALPDGDDHELICCPQHTASLMSQVLADVLREATR